MRRTVVGIAFACGGLVHAAGFVLHKFGVELYRNYPAWRHPIMVVVDATIAWIAIRRPRWLFAALAGFLLEQIAVNGIPAIVRWRTTGEGPWFVAIYYGAIVLALMLTWRIGEMEARSTDATLAP
jgi:hypothetical protein